jgi:ribonucleoside-triphosphate reductase
LFGEKNVPAVMYSNQFIPLWGDATIWERLETDGRYNKLITGGGIVHAQIGEKVTAKQAENIIKFAVKSGCEHFALNAVYSQCSKDHTTFGKIETCPVCGEKIKDYLTRVVGFFVKVSNMNKTRREWEFPKRTFIDLKN